MRCPPTEPTRPPLSCPLPFQALLAEASTLPGLQHVRRWVVGGRSMGARAAASIAGEAQPPVPVAGALLLAYPLHAPGKPSEAGDRAALLHSLRVPTLLVRGTNDPFSQQAAWEAALRGMAPACLWQEHTVPGGNHSLRVGGKDGAAKSQAALEAVCAAVQQFARQLQAGAGGEGAACPQAGAGGAKAAVGSKAGRAPAPGKRKAPAAGKPEGAAKRRGRC